jgi:hypothetical protein
MDRGWETKEEIRSAFEAKSLPFSERKLERWRDERLLPKVDQIKWDYKGSEVRYPLGTAAQAIAIQELLGEKRKFDYVGWELWWRGFSIDECHGRPKLFETAKWGDRALHILKRLNFRDERRNSPTAISDRVVQSGTSNSLYLKIKRRIAYGEIPALFGVILDTATGDFDGAIPEDLEPTLVQASDFEQSNSDQILGKRLRLIDALPGVLHDISRVSKRYSMAHVAAFPVAEVEAARDDVRGAMQIATDLYEATWWIYGAKSFGLRLAAWLAQKSSPVSRAFFTLIFAARRSDGHLFLSSDEIKRLVSEAALVRRQAVKLRALQSDSRFSEVLSAKRLRRGLRTPDEHWTLLKEIEAARLQRVRV